MSEKPILEPRGVEACSAQAPHQTGCSVFRNLIKWVALSDPSGREMTLGFKEAGWLGKAGGEGGVSQWQYGVGASFTVTSLNWMPMTGVI